MKQKKHIIFVAGFLILFLSVGFSTLKNRDLELVKNLDIYYTLFRELNMFYVDETDPEELVTTSIEAMLSSLDPYTTFIPESDMDDFQFQTTGEYGGIGSLIRRSGEQVMIAEPYEGFPAAKAGVRAGDIILEVDGVPTKKMEIEKVSDKLKGKPGTELKLVIKRYGEEKNLEIPMIREKISILNVPYYGMIEPGTGYIRISNFTTGASYEVENALKELKRENELNSLVLDLRSNPGGLLLEAVRICNLFVDKGELIVSTRGKMTQWDSEYSTSREPIDKGIPLVVLVNRGSASASEIVAGALQDLDRAVIVGQRTFGKGLVQTSRPLKYNAQLKVTTAKYYIPSGRCIQALDYKHRNPDGSVGSVPDSLITEYTTRNERLVYDGGGIEPDFEVIPEILSEIALQLFTQSMFFDFAVRYHNTHDEIESPDIFSLSDNDYALFEAFIEEKDFEFRTSSEKAFAQLVTSAKREKYYEFAEAEFSSLEEKLSHNNLKDLETFEKEIRQILTEEIVNHYYFQAGRILSQIQEDPQLYKATEIINEPGMLKEVLSGNLGALARASE
ncbi:MAG: peptidase S41 [Bacteroidetes bacterium]|nr:MAG: peptidase S41 [Bacteroidota bacterium]HDN58688.1 S41 family peptidase [Candidatus Neomarinimicrobiota bacterium]